MTGILLAVPLLPLLAAVGSLLAGRRLRFGGGELVLGAVALALAALLPLADGNGRLSREWLVVGAWRLTVGLAADPLGWSAAVLVAAVALCVCLYALGYMAGEPDRPRFFAALGLFVGAMLALVLADSFLLLFAAWEAVGLASWRLIGFRHREPGAAAAATRAFLMTRIGDVGLLLGWLLALGTTGTTGIGAALEAARGGAWPPGLPTLVALLMLAGAVGKSAQLPLSAWLPDAMIGPTPVSALLHSATMVAAGVFLLLRLDPLFGAAPAARAAVFWIGAASALFASLVATAEPDLKRVLAWSTVAQLGEMLVALGLAAPLAAAFHLASHAAFKATLFLAAGVVERRTGTRALDRLGGLARVLPFAALVFALAGAALAGIPPLSGYWSEEEILGAAVARGPAAALLLLALIFLSGTYIARAGVATFGRPSPSPSAAPGIRQVPGGAFMAAGMALLAVPVVGLGWLLAGPALPRLLPFLAGPPAAATPWPAVAVAAGLAGLTVGGARAWRSGAAPALGAWPGRLADGLAAVTRAPVEVALRAAAALDALERQLDRAARGLAAMATAWAGRTEAAEQGFDAAARASAGATWSLALRTEEVEAEGFARGGDRLAASLARGGEGLRGLQAGPLYLYTLGLFAWVAGAVALVGLALLL